MGKRDDLFRKFGPIMFEAFAILLLTEINTLRQRAGLPVYTKDQVLTALDNHLSTLQPYDWMNTR